MKVPPAITLARTNDAITIPAIAPPLNPLSSALSLSLEISDGAAPPPALLGRGGDGGFVGGEFSSGGTGVPKRFPVISESLT